MKIGDKYKFVGKEDYNNDYTYGNIYEIISIVQALNCIEMTYNFDKISGYYFNVDVVKKNFISLEELRKDKMKTICK